MSAAPFHNMVRKDILVATALILCPGKANEYLECQLRRYSSRGSSVVRAVGLDAKLEGPGVQIRCKMFFKFELSLPH